MNPEQASIRVMILRPGVAPVETLPESGPDASQASQTPPIDIFEEPEGLILEADLPGVRQEDVIVQLDQNVLTLFAKFGPLFPEDARLLHEEFPRMNYLRSFILTDDVDRDHISAEMSKGVLRLILPKAARAKPRRIEIKSS